MKILVLFTACPPDVTPTHLKNNPELVLRSKLNTLSTLQGETEDQTAPP